MKFPIQLLEPCCFLMFLVLLPAHLVCSALNLWGFCGSSCLVHVVEELTGPRFRDFGMTRWWVEHLHIFWHHSDLLTSFSKWILNDVSPCLTKSGCLSYFVTWSKLRGWGHHVLRRPNIMLFFWNFHPLILSPRWHDVEATWCSCPHQLPEM